MDRIVTFLREVRIELAKVSWPNRSQMTRYVGVVLGLCLFFAVYLGGIDAGLTWLIGRLVIR